MRLCNLRLTLGCLAAGCFGACSLTSNLDDLVGSDAGKGGPGGVGGTTADAPPDAPVAVKPSPPFQAIAAGGLHACALDAKGDVWCWGSNLNGQLGQGALGGKSGAPSRVDLPDKSKSLAAGAYHSCAVLVDGTVYCWGGGTAGQLGSGIVDVPVPTEVPITAGMLSVAAGASHSCARSAAEVYCWGNNSRGQLGVQGASPAPPQKLALPTKSLAAGALHTCGVSGAGVLCWGANESGQLGDGQTNDASQPQKANISSTAPKAVALGGRHSCAVAEGGQLECWGSNAKGQLGIGAPGPVPVAPSIVNDVSASNVALGDVHTCAIALDGGLFCWGDDAGEQLGNGPGQTAAPKPFLLSLKELTSLSVGTSFSCAAAEAGLKLLCWGDNKTQQLGKSTELAEPLPVAVY